MERDAGVEPDAWLIDHHWQSRETVIDEGVLDNQQSVHLDHGCAESGWTWCVLA